MSKYYQGKRTTGLFNPESNVPFRLSRSKIDLFLNCPRCFYIDRRLGVGQPPGYPFSLNSAVDKLLKKEFDIHRAKKTTHPLMEHYGIDAVPFSHTEIETWRNPFKGISYTHKETDLLIFGGVDDVWINPNNDLIIVDYKATSKDEEVTLDADWQIGYKRQMEIYQWLFKKNNYPVLDTGYFVYCNGITDKEAFDGKLEFDIKIIPYKGNTSWVDQTLNDIKTCLMSDTIPNSNPECDFCIYRHAVKNVES